MTGFWTFAKPPVIQGEILSPSAIGDFSKKPADYFIAPPPGEKWDVNRCIVHIEDKKQTFWNDDQYGSVRELSRGIQFLVLDWQGEILVNLMDGFPVKSTGDWGRFCYDARPVPREGGPTGSFQVRWTFTKAGSPSDKRAPLQLNGALRERLVVRLRDDFTHLKDQTFSFQGMKRRAR